MDSLTKAFCSRCFTPLKKPDPKTSILAAEFSEGVATELVLVDEAAVA